MTRFNTQFSAEGISLFNLVIHLHLVILQTLLSKATNNWGKHKMINLEEANTGIQHSGWGWEDHSTSQEW